MRKMIAGLAVLGLSLASATPSDAQVRHPVPAGATETMMLGWERHFTLDWSVGPTPLHGHRISGYVINGSGANVNQMRVLAQAIDASGTVVDKRMSWVLGGVNAFGRAYFEIGDLPPSDRYRVTVWDYDVI